MPLITPLSQAQPTAEDDLIYYLSSKLQEKYFSLDFNERVHSYKKKKSKKKSLSKYLKLAQKQVVLKPSLSELDSFSWKSVILQRQSRNRFSGSISFSQLSTLLTAACGYKEFLKTSAKRKRTLKQRNFPSAGALYTLRFYVLALNVTGLSPGLYSFDAENNSLILLRRDKEIFQLKNFWAQVGHFKNPSALIFATSLIDDCRAKYGLRALRFIFMETGAVGFHLQMLCERFNLGFSFDGGGFDGKIEKILGIDGLQEGLISTFVLGKP